MCSEAAWDKASSRRDHGDQNQRLSVRELGPMPCAPHISSNEQSQSSSESGALEAPTLVHIRNALGATRTLAIRYPSSFRSACADSVQGGGRLLDNADTQFCHDLRDSGSRPRSSRVSTSGVLVVIMTAAGIIISILIGYSFTTQRFDTPRCRMSYMRPFYRKFSEFDVTYTRFATKYSLYLYPVGAFGFT
jgi:hypothetical protein